MLGSCFRCINLLHAYKKFRGESFIPLLQMKNTGVHRLSSLTTVTWLVEQDFGFEPMPWAPEPGF